MLTKQLICLLICLLTTTNIDPAHFTKQRFAPQVIEFQHKIVARTAQLKQEADLQQLQKLKRNLKRELKADKEFKRTFEEILTTTNPNERKELLLSIEEKIQRLQAELYQQTPFRA